MKIKSVLFSFLFTVTFLIDTHAQTGNFPFEIVLKADSIAGFNGLHARQPFNAFPSSQNNQILQVLDLATQQYWSRSLSELSVSLREQLHRTTHFQRPTSPHQTTQHPMKEFWEEYSI